MSLVSAAYLAFVLAAVMIYYLLPGKARRWWLLTASIAFCAFCGFYTLFFVLLTAFTTFAGGLLAGRQGKTWQRNLACVITVVFNLAIMCAVKFYGVMDLVAEDLNNFFGASVGVREFMLYLVPVGMSFYTLQMVGYVLDCTWDRVKPERNIGRYLLFATYFPYITSGPMNSYAGLSAELDKSETAVFSIQRLKEGAIRIAWGFFKKLVIADRIAVMVNAAYGDHITYTGLYTALGVFCFAIQLYTDFSGCIDIVLGTSHLLGIELNENFNSPYLSRSIREYWRRWHITLGSWLRDYLYYPVLKSAPLVKIGDVSRKALGKKRGKKVPVYVGMLILWFSVGYWHGGMWTYIIGSGLLHCIYIVSGMLFEPLFEKVRGPLRSDRLPYKTFQIIRTFILVLLGFVFFRSRTVPEAIDMFAAFTRAGGIAFNAQGIYSMGLDLANIIVLIVSVAILVAVDIYQYTEDDAAEHRSALALVCSKPAVVSWAVFMVLVLAVIIFGRYGLGYDSGAFIYARI